MNKLRNICFAAIVLSFLAFGGSTAFAKEAYVTLDRVNYRVSPSLDADIIMILEPGEPVTVEQVENSEWALVVYQNYRGYMNLDYIGKRDSAATKETQKEDQTYQKSQQENVKDAPVIDDETQGLEPDTTSQDQPVIKEEAGNASSVEMLSWGEAKELFTTGMDVEVIDVRTGTVYYVRSFSNGNHADVEPITSDDTAALLATYGGRWDWDTRPVWVTLHGRKIAASISGMPHGGGINNNNGMNGQICIHFKGSTTHNGNRAHERDHQASVQEAYNAG